MWKYIRLFVVVVLLILVMPETSHGKAFKWGDSDPAPGTAPKHIEDAIEAGKKLVGKSDYLYGGGRNESTYGKLMDCSALMHYIFNKGSGILLVNDNPKHAGGVATEIMKSKMDVINNVAHADLERGDLVFFTGHVGIYLGDGIMLNDASSSGVSYARVDKGYWGDRYLGQVVKIKEGAKGVTFTDGGGIGGELSVKEEEDSTGDNTAKGLEKYISREVTINSTGVKDNQDILGADKRNMFTDISKDAYNLFIKIGVLLSYAFIAYTTTAVAAYFVITKRGASATVEGKFEKVTGVEAAYNTENTKKILIRWLVSTILLMLFLVGSYVDLMAIIYRLIERVWIF